MQVTIQSYVIEDFWLNRVKIWKTEDTAEFFRDFIDGAKRQQMAVLTALCNAPTIIYWYYISHSWLCRDKKFFTCSFRTSYCSMTITYCKYLLHIHSLSIQTEHTNVYIQFVYNVFHYAALLVSFMNFSVSVTGDTNLWLLTDVVPDHYCLFLSQIPVQLDTD